MVLASLLCAWLSVTAWAGPDDTPGAMDRLEEVLALRLEAGEVTRDQVMPAILVSAQPRYDVSAVWFSTRAIEVIERNFGSGTLRLCEACMAPRTYAEGGALVYQAGPAGLDEIARLDHETRGAAPAAKTAIWIDEHRGGVSIRIVELSTGRVIFAQNVDPTLTEYSNSRRLASMASELERRARGESLAQAFVDFALFPRQHLSLDFTDQWGKSNGAFSGVTLTILDPLIGVGFTHAQRIPLGNTLVGVKGVVSMPTAIARGLSSDVGEIADPLLTGVGFVRVPFGRSNYGLVATVSTNGRIGLGVSLLNIRILPVLP